MARPKRAPGVMSPRMAQMMALADGTRTRAAVAAAMGIKQASIHSLVRTAVEEGFEPLFIETAVGRPSLTSLLRHQRLPRIRLDLPPDVARWFLAQIPQGGTADDLVRGFIVDAFNEEVGQ